MKRPGWIFRPSASAAAGHQPGLAGAQPRGGPELLRVREQLPRRCREGVPVRSVRPPQRAGHRPCRRLRQQVDLQHAFKRATGRRRASTAASPRPTERPILHARSNIPGPALPSPPDPTKEVRRCVAMDARWPAVGAGGSGTRRGVDAADVRQGPRSQWWRAVAVGTASAGGGRAVGGRPARALAAQPGPACRALCRTGATGRLHRRAGL